MRYLLLCSQMLVIVSCDKPSPVPAQRQQQQQPATTATSPEQAVVGSWRSEDLGLDFPIWMVDTYAADGTVRTDFYSKPRDKEIHHADKTSHGNWRIGQGRLEVGK